MLFLRAPLAILGELEWVPETLTRLGYDHSRVALLYALGYESTLHEEGWIPESESEEAVRGDTF